MGRLKKITAAEVLEILANKGQITISDLASDLEVTPETIRNRLRELRQDGEAIIHGKNGLLIIDKGTIMNDEEMAQAFKLWIEWVLKIFRGLMICAKPTQPLLPTLRKSFKESLDSDERKLLSQSCVRVKAFLDYAQAEDEDAE